jgi:hypothetical protein
MPMTINPAKETRWHTRVADRLVSLFVRNEKIKPDVMLQFYLEVIGTDYLHEDYVPDRTYDLILMSESVQYQRLEESFPNARRALNPGGYLLTSDFYRLESARDVKDRALPSHFLNDLLARAQAHGFELIHEDDITQETAPSLDYGKMVFERYIRPTLRLQLNALRVHLPLAYKLFRLVLRVPVKGEPMEKIIRNHLTPPDPELYRKHMCYRIHLFRKRG